jgi:hypothetical protein
MRNTKNAIMFAGTRPPPLSAPNTATLYYDIATNDMLISENGGAFTSITTGGGGGGGWTDAGTDVVLTTSTDDVGMCAVADIVAATKLTVDGSVQVGIGVTPTRIDGTTGVTTIGATAPIAGELLYVAGDATVERNLQTQTISQEGGSPFHIIDAGGSNKISIDLGRMGFWGAAPAPQYTITGSRAGNLALESLLVALDGMGLVVDNTTP